MIRTKRLEGVQISYLLLIIGHLLVFVDELAPRLLNRNVFDLLVLVRLDLYELRRRALSPLIDEVTDQLGDFEFALEFGLNAFFDDGLDLLRHPVAGLDQLFGLLPLLSRVLELFLDDQPAARHAIGRLRAHVELPKPLQVLHREACSSIMPLRVQHELHDHVLLQGNLDVVVGALLERHVNQEAVWVPSRTRKWPQVRLNRLLPEGGGRRSVKVRGALIADAESPHQLLVILDLRLQVPRPYLFYVPINLVWLQVLKFLVEKVTEHLKVDGVVAVHRLPVDEPVHFVAILFLPMYSQKLLAVLLRYADELLYLELEDEIHLPELAVKMGVPDDLLPEVIGLVNIFECGGDEEIAPRFLQKDVLIVGRRSLDLVHQHPFGDAQRSKDPSLLYLEQLVEPALEDGIDLCVLDFPVFEFLGRITIAIGVQVAQLDLVMLLRRQQAVLPLEVAVYEDGLWHVECLLLRRSLLLFDCGSKQLDRVPSADRRTSLE